MGNDIFESIPQGGDGTKDSENRRIEEIADELQRLCQLHEKECGAGKAHVSRFDIEQRCAEQYAKEHEIWVPMNHIFDLGVPGPSGNENDTYVTDSYIYKVNNLLNSRGIIKFLQKILLHNIIFPETSYSIWGFTGYEGRSVYPVVTQERICDSHPATSIMIDTYMSALGFTKIDDEGRYTNAMYEVWDLFPRNVLVDKEGDIYVVDAEIRERPCDLK